MTRPKVLKVVMKRMMGGDVDESDESGSDGDADAESDESDDPAP